MESGGEKHADRDVFKKGAALPAGGPVGVRTKGVPNRPCRSVATYLPNDDVSAVSGYPDRDTRLYTDLSVE